jgi:hypothetical protein
MEVLGPHLDLSEHPDADRDQEIKAAGAQEGHRVERTLPVSPCHQPSG